MTYRYFVHMVENNDPRPARTSFIIAYHTEVLNNTQFKAFHEYCRKELLDSQATEERKQIVMRLVIANFHLISMVDDTKNEASLEDLSLGTGEEQ